MRQNINTYTSLAKEIAYRLGAPQNYIPLVEEQIYSAIDDALDLYSEYHVDGTRRVSVLFKLTKEESESKCIKFNIPVYSVVRVYGERSSLGIYVDPLDIANLGYTYTSIGGVNVFSPGYWDNWHITNYFINQQKLSLLDRIFDNNIAYDYNPNNATLYFNSHVAEDQVIIVDAYVKNFLRLDENQVTQISRFDGSWSYDGSQVFSGLDEAEIPQNGLGNRIVRKLAPAYAMKQWAIVLMQTDNIDLMGGIKTNPSMLLEVAERDIEKYEESLIEDLSGAMPFLIG